MCIPSLMEVFDLEQQPSDGCLQEFQQYFDVDV